MTKKSLIFAAALVASISIAGVASAQTSPFEGFYAGGQAGYSSINVEVSAVGLGSADETMDGFGGGGFIGFGGTNGSLYGSIQAEVGYDGAEWSETSGGLTVGVETQLTYGVGFRVGGVVADNLLIYGRVGWVRTNAEGTVTLAGVGSASDDEDFDGLRIGGGVEAMLADNIGVRGEYTYTQYEEPSNPSGLDWDINQHLFRVGVAYYF
jgi:outer membrane immunogenic protein